MTMSPSWELIQQNVKLRKAVEQTVDHNKTMAAHIKNLTEELAGSHLILYVMLRRYCEGEARISMQDIIDATGGNIQRSFAPDADEKKGCYIYTALPPDGQPEAKALSPVEFAAEEETRKLMLEHNELL